MPSGPLSYPSLGDLPILLVNIINSRTGGEQMFQMLVDTGSARTCLPADRAEFFGHNNQDQQVKTTTIRGIGGPAKAHIHTLRIELVDPLGRTWRKLMPPWRSAMKPVLFTETIDLKTGILGRDILSQWESVTFRPTPHAPDSEWLIEIAL